MQNSINTMDMAEHEAWFREYARRKTAVCDKDKEPLRLKTAHTFKVYANAKIITEDEGLGPVLQRAALLAALYHDVARFEQYLEFGTFHDAHSFNHGQWGKEILLAESRFARELPEVAGLAILAVEAHNRKELPDSLDARQTLVCNLVRDADKLDILRVMDAHLAQKPYNPTVVLSLPDDDSKHNPKVAEDAMSRRCASYGDLRCVNDFRLLLGSWYYNLNFDSSRRIFLRAGHGHKLLAALPDNSSYGTARRILLERFCEEEKKLA